MTIRTDAKYKTRNPDLWNCYWGLRDAKTVEPVIFVNRDELERKYLLRKSRIRLPAMPTEIDHPEIYRQYDDTLLFVCSNYGECKPPFGNLFREIDPIYSLSCKSFATNLRNGQHLRILFELMEENL